MNRETAGRILPENDNYEKLRRYWAAEVAKMDFPALAKRFDLRYDGAALYIRYFAREYRVARQSGEITALDAPEDRLNYDTVMAIWHLFYYSKPEARVRGEFVPFRSVRRLAPFEPNYQQTILKPFARAFSGKPELLRLACEKLGGRPIRQGDVGYQIDVFSCMPLCVTFWDADEEFEAQANILFDADITDFLHEETVVLVASDLTAQLFRAAGLTDRAVSFGNDH